MTPAQCRDARRLLGLSQRAVARFIGLSATSIGKFEATGGLPATQAGFPEWRAELRGMFEEAGIEFTNGDAPGVKLRGNIADET